MRVAVEVAADPRAEAQRRRRAGDERPQLCEDARRGVPQRGFDEPESGADLVDDARPARAHLVGLPEDRDLLGEVAADTRLGGGRQIRVVELAQQRRKVAVLGEDGAPRRLRRVGGEDELDRDPPHGLLHVGLSEELDRLGEGLARRLALVLVLAAAP